MNPQVQHPLSLPLFPDLPVTSWLYASLTILYYYYYC